MEEQKELVKNDVAIIQALKSSLYPGAKDESVAMVLSYCKAAGLDPMTKPVHLVPMNVKDSKTGKYDWRDVVMPGIELYRTKASRTKEHAGTTEPEFGPTIEKTFKGKDKDGKAVSVTVSFPEWCRVTARRLVGGKIVEFTAKEFWLENYATAGRDSEIPNAMWQKRPFGQLAKCSEAQALRKGFPEVGAQPTADEMAGKTIDAEGVVADLLEQSPTGIKPKTEPPRTKTTKKTMAEYAAEVASIATVDALTEWYKTNVKSCQRDLDKDEQGELLGLISKRKKEIEPVEEPKKVACPDRDGDMILTSYCDGECKSREGCPAYA